MQPDLAVLMELVVSQGKLITQLRHDVDILKAAVCASSASRLNMVYHSKETIKGLETEPLNALD